MSKTEELAIQEKPKSIVSTMVGWAILLLLGCILVLMLFAAWQVTVGKKIQEIGASKYNEVSSWVVERRSLADSVDDALADDNKISGWEYRDIKFTRDDLISLEEHRALHAARENIVAVLEQARSEKPKEDR